MPEACQNRERRQHATYDAVSDSTAPELLTAIVAHCFLRNLDQRVHPRVNFPRPTRRLTGTCKRVLDRYLPSCAFRTSVPNERGHNTNPELQNPVE